jgi:MHS family alpha-ketoglutarate permease-like MFS transporter
MATGVNLAGLVFFMLLQPVGGMLSDRVGRKPLLVFFGVGGVLYTSVLLALLPHTTSPLTAFVLTAIGYIVLTGYTSVNAIVKAEVFPARVRALGVGLGYAVANSVFGGTAPLVYQSLLAADATLWYVAYVTAVIGVSLVTYVFFTRNRPTTPLDREQGSAWSAAG